jgi:hypothetical protein
MLMVLVLIVAAAVAIGVWRGFGAVQWIWLIAGIALTMVALWVIMLIFVVGPGMQRMGPPGR